MASFLSYFAAFMVLSLLRYNFNFVDIIRSWIPVFVYISLFQIWCSFVPLIATKLIKSYRKLFSLILVLWTLEIKKLLRVDQWSFYRKFSHTDELLSSSALKDKPCRVYKMDWLGTKTIRAKRRQRNVKENGEVILQELIECCDGKCNPIKNFSYNQIIKATDNFCQNNRASRIDVYYRCYKGMLDDRPVLIKKGKYTLDMKEICRDIAISSMVGGHNNFLKLLGCCLEFTPPVLVFEYAEIITLGPLLASHPGNLRRIKIAREVANALTYLHTAFSRVFIHSNLDPFTIFLDGNGVAKLGNFCNCILIPEGETFVHDDTLKKYHEFRHNTLKGTHGLGVCNLPVIDPDYKSTGKVTTKTDMYSFGAFMLALVQIREVDDELSDMLRALADLFIKPYDDAHFPLHHHVSKILKKFGYAEVIDPGMSDVAAWPIKAFLRLALRCIGCNLGDPLTSMIQVAKELRLIEKSTYYPPSADCR